MIKMVNFMLCVITVKKKKKYGPHGGEYGNIQHNKIIYI